jgi:putative transposase
VLEQVAHGHGWQIVANKVRPDQVHRSVRVGPANARASVVGTLGGRTARVLRDEFP